MCVRRAISVVVVVVVVAVVVREGIPSYIYYGILFIVRAGPAAPGFDANILFCFFFSPRRNRRIPYDPRARRHVYIVYTRERDFSKTAMIFGRTKTTTAKKP